VPLDVEDLRRLQLSIQIRIEEARAVATATCFGVT
jgi:hypothetical protein